jgi:LPS export ABC transporter permease LptF/LPS export ABC transporter permease LptG
MLQRAVDRYIITAVLPYIALGLAILTIILLIQQTTRFADILGSSGAPLRLTLDVALNLLPNLLIFTLPMSTLVGVATGFSRMGHDSELIAMRAAGIGTIRIILPTLILGGLIGLTTFYVGFTVAPAAAQNLREIGLRAAFYKLESPVEPRSFYTGMPGKVVYVREGDRDSGQWEKIFIYWQESDGRVRLATAQKGRLDFSGDQTELVLEDATMTTLPAGGVEAIERGEHVTIERSASMRVKDDRLNAGRSSLAKRIREREPEFDEMGLAQLEEKTRSEPDRLRRREAQLALHKRLALSFSPIIFAFFGACLGLRSIRGGRSQGVALSLVSMLLYYLISLAGEQLGRAGVVPPIIGSWLAFCLAIICALALLWSRYWRLNIGFTRRLRTRTPLKERGESTKGQWASSLLGLLDRRIFRSLTWNFLFTFCSLVLVFVIFTLFELLRFIAINHISGFTVAQYFIFLLPFTCIAVAPVSTLLSVLVTFALMVRRSESIAWWASGQSVFRLIVPCIFFAAILGACIWSIQEKLMPSANRRQNILRGIIRSGTAQTEAQQGRTWISSTDSRRIYTFDSTIEGGQLVENLMLFKLNPDLMQLEQILTTKQAILNSSAIMMTEAVEQINIGGQTVTHAQSSGVVLPAEDFQALNTGFKKPSEFDSESLSAYIKTLKVRGVNVNPLLVALERRRVELFYPLVMVLVGAPLALVLGRRSSMLALCIAIGIGLAFLGITNGLQQVGASGLLSPIIAVWSPPFLFLAVGIYLLSRSQT